jgi:pimeloyl-ACP methyl ester carboxylesterase
LAESVVPALGGCVADWLAVQDRLAALTTVCVYDRPGLGWSDPEPAWPTAGGMARGLHDLLDAAGLRPPFVLAGHSMGGLVARVFAWMYPGEVAGMALIDASHPQQHARLPTVYLEDRPGGTLAAVALNFMRPLGLRRLKRHLAGPRASGPALDLWSRGRRASAKELLAFDRICREAGVITGDLGDLPLTVITSSERNPGLSEASREQRARSRFYPAWAALQNENAALSASSVHIVAPSAGHHVQRDDPELVISAMAELVQRARARTSSR